MRVGLVSPYSFDVPGGVQLHVRDLAEHLLGRGHEVSVLAPSDPGTPLPPYLVSAGPAVPVRYNGSVARVAFGPAVSARVGEWLQDGCFDVVHIHEPATPSVSVLALWAVRGPVVATFHSATLRSRALRAAQPVLRPSLEKLSARIAVSEAARATVQAHLGHDTLVIPNGVYVERFARDPGTANRGGFASPDRPTVTFLGRFEEPRKGLEVLTAAIPWLRARHPDVEVLIAGPGDVDEAVQRLGPDALDCCRFLGPLSHQEKVALLTETDVYVAPNTGGESFGIILIEAMSAGAAVVASDLPAFDAVLGGGRYGMTFPVGDPEGLADRLSRVLGDTDLRSRLARQGLARAREYDWSRVGEQVVAVYESVRTAGEAQVSLEAGPRPWGRGRWRRR